MEYNGECRVVLWLTSHTTPL